MTTTVLNVEGMTCGHCAQTVKKILSAAPGVGRAEVSLEEKRAVLTSEGPVDLSKAAPAIEEEGYKISLVSQTP